MRKFIRRSFLAGLVLFILIQFVPYSAAEIEARGEIQAPPEVQAILHRACYDCHSAAPRIPWYGRVAPVSWLVAHDIEEGREHLNFSDWSLMSAKDQAEAREEIIEEVEEGEMPLAIYLKMHDEAKLDRDDLATLRAWAGMTGHAGEHEEGERDGD
ncbi:MAG: heme-binding domain-containing protein [Planctomycetes bacterium]|nr:heme-binding domain-containing protein [Planctomycetota bacterium]